MFKITITEITNEVSKKQEWRHLSGEGDSAKYGYGPEIPCVNTTETTRLSQTVDTINMAAVIKAINGL